MSNICQNLYLCNLSIDSKDLSRLTEELSQKIEQDFSVEISGINHSGTKGIKKYSKSIFNRISKNEDLKYITVYFGGASCVNDEWLVFLEIDNFHLSLIFTDRFYTDKTLDKKNISDIISNKYIANFDFGFINYMDQKKLPEYYNIGISDSDLSRNEKDKIRSWNLNFNLEDGQYKPGDLRDVYPYNIISELHLNRNVHGQTLESWIKSDPSHGTLEKISDTHWLWTVEDQHIPKAQEVLSSAHLLVAYWEKY